MKLGAYTITIDVAEEGGDKPLDEHQVEIKGNEISCWIASEEGKVSSLTLVVFFWPSLFFRLFPFVPSEC